MLNNRLIDLYIIEEDEEKESEEDDDGTSSVGSFGGDGVDVQDDSSDEFVFGFFF